MDSNQTKPTTNSVLEADCNGATVFKVTAQKDGLVINYELITGDGYDDYFIHEAILTLGEDGKLLISQAEPTTLGDDLLDEPDKKQKYQRPYNPDVDEYPEYLHEEALLLPETDPNHPKWWSN